jgi:hypothetical protein
VFQILQTKRLVPSLDKHIEAHLPSNHLKQQTKTTKKQTNNKITTTKKQQQELNITQTKQTKQKQNKRNKRNKTQTTLQMWFCSL